MSTTLVDDFLEHAGVKGMKWGVRKAESQERINNGNHTSPKNPNKVARAEKKAAKKAAREEEDRQIIGARIRQEKRVANLNNKAAATYTATTKKGQKAAEEAYARAEKKALNNPDVETSQKLTSGERAVARVNTAVALTAIGFTLAVGVGSAILDSK